MSRYFVSIIWAVTVSSCWGSFLYFSRKPCAPGSIAFVHETDVVYQVSPAYTAHYYVLCNSGDTFVHELCNKIAVMMSIRKPRTEMFSLEEVELMQGFKRLGNLATPEILAQVDLDHCDGVPVRLHLPGLESLCEKFQMRKTVDGEM